MADLNPMQRAALAFVRGSNAPVSAYDVLAALRAARASAAPPTAYRALDRLIALGLVHRLETLNAYVACSSAHGAADPAFQICDDCGHVEEFAAPDVAEGLAARAERKGFAPRRQVVELHGRCAGCRSA